MKAWHKLLAISISILFIGKASPLKAQNNNPIPNRILGLELGKVYSDEDVYFALRQYNSYGNYNYKGNGKYRIKEYTFSTVTFGGYDWECVRVGLIQDAIFDITFSQHFDNYSDAIARKQDLQNRIESKYGRAHQKESFTFWYDSNNDIFLKVSREQAMNNNYYYYVHLSYDKAYLLDRISAAMNEEL